MFGWKQEQQRDKKHALSHKKKKYALLFESNSEFP